MKKIIYLILLSNAFTLTLKAQTTQGTYIYRNYKDSIVRVPYPSYVVQGSYIYRTYPKSIVRTPYPIGKIGNGIPE